MPINISSKTKKILEVIDATTVSTAVATNPPASKGTLR
jgi:hypothetical protein